MTLAGHDRIFIWGYGREGRAAHDLIRLEAPDVPVTIVDENEPTPRPDQTDWIGEADLAQAVAGHPASLIIKSPGVSLYHPVLDAALAQGATLTSQTNLYLERRPTDQFVIAITGTKGKSTTASLLHHMLSALGHVCALAGNIGEPALHIARDARFVVLELSSYQIADLVHAPDAFIFLNLSNDHAPWHHGIERYQADKARLARLDPNIPGVMGARDERLKALFGHQPNRVWFGQESGLHERDAEVWHGDQRLGSLPGLPGAHNALNACAALAMVDSLGLDTAAAFASLSEFSGLPHRMQTVHQSGDLRFVDDGLATTPEACINALSAFADQPVALILGGEDRQQDYAWLAEHLEAFDTIRAIFTLADNGKTILKALQSGRHGKITRHVGEVDAAVSAAASALPDGGVVLLSPAAPRSKAYRSYVDRGAAFLAAAKALD